MGKWTSMGMESGTGTRRLGEIRRSVVVGGEKTGRCVWTGSRLGEAGCGWVLVGSVGSVARTTVASAFSLSRV